MTQQVHMNGASFPTKEVHDERTAEAEEDIISTVARGNAKAPIKHASTP
jgi:hypothetical protein